MGLLELLAATLIALGGFFTGRNYERHHPTTAAEAQSNLAVGEFFKNLFKRKQ